MLDEKDTEILEELKRDGRESTVHISRKTGIPRVTVHERIRKMVSGGILRKFTVIPDYKKLGLGTTAFILITYDPHSDVTQRQVADKIAKLPNVNEIHILAGEWDMIAKVRAGSVEDVGKLVIDKLREMDGVEKTYTITCFETAKDEP